ncbi:hypothetical protein WJX72_012103 [[Myrmecia] bisecta]|uniref:Uncharacterized protein n=1 Tax=[Myrmecia] bisecta TaxID=41462 RepID=A0AAW1QT29_9CHLO
MRVVCVTQPQHPGLPRSRVVRSAVLAPAFTLLATAPHRALAVPPAQPNPGQVRLATGAACTLAVSIWPQFTYNALGGGGNATVTAGREPGRQYLEFDVASVEIPDLSFATAKVLGLPLPPPLRIAIQPLSLQGWIDRTSGAAELEFHAKFCFTASSLYKAAPLLVATRLTTSKVQGARLQGEGVPFQGECCRGRLVGISELQPTGDRLLDSFLMLPSQCIAELDAQLSFG